MLLSIITILVVSYLLVCSIAYVLAYLLISDRSIRKLFAILGFLVPPLAVWAVVKTLLKRTPSPGYSEQLAAVEDEIETERVAIFGGEPLKPSFSEKWRNAYLYFLARAAKKVEKFVGPHDLTPSASLHTK